MQKIKHHIALHLSLLAIGLFVILVGLKVPKIMAENTTNINPTDQKTSVPVTQPASNKPAEESKTTTETPADTSNAVSNSKDTANNTTAATKADTPAIKTDPTITPQVSAKTDSGSKTDNARSENDTDLTPELNFSSPRNGQTIQGQIEIKSSVADATNVEFYLVASNSNTKKYIGVAKKQSGSSTWTLSFDSQKSPNGAFYLTAKIVNKYGSYESGRLSLNINNQTQAAGQKDEQPAATQQDGNRLSTEERAAAEQPIQQDENRLPTEERAATVQEQPSQQNQNAATENLNGKIPAQWQEQYFHNPLCQDEKQCGEGSDPDKDELNNADEYRFGTDPLDPDTDGDGFLDGDEIKNGFNPLKFSPGDKSDKMVFENPKELGEIKKDIYRVLSVSATKNTRDENILRISGKGLPNSFINIYIFSSLPIILTVKTDAEGNWIYDLDKQLEDGDHEVYIAITDNTGKITAKSEPLFFVKKAEAVTMIDQKKLPVRMRYTQPPTESRATSDFALLIIIILLSLGLALSIIGIIVVRKPQPEKL